MLYFIKEEIELLPSDSQKKSNESECGTIEADIWSNILISRLPYAIENAVRANLCDKLSFPELRACPSSVLLHPLPPQYGNNGRKDSRLTNEVMLAPGKEHRLTRGKKITLKSAVATRNMIFLKHKIENGEEENIFILYNREY